MSRDIFIAEYDDSLWECLTVNTHENKIIITDDHYSKICGLNGIVDAVRIGSHGMELALIVDTSDMAKLKMAIDNILDFSS